MAETTRLRILIDENGAATNNANAVTASLGKLAREALSVQRGLNSVASKDPFSALGKNANAVNKETFAVRQQIVALQRVVAGGVGTDQFDKLNRQIAESSRRLTTLNRQRDSFQSRQALPGGTPAAGAGGIAGLLGTGGISKPVAGLLGGGSLAATAGGVGAGLFLAKQGFDIVDDLAQAAGKVEDSYRLLSSAAKEAGIGFDIAKGKAQAFKDITGQTAQQSNESTAAILNFAKAAGRIDKVDQFSKAFADLSAARGIKPEDQAQRVQQLNQLIDEATDKLLFANPSAFYDEYAKSIDTTAVKLDDAGKRAAVFDQIIKRGAFFDGSAAERLKSTTGQLEVYKNRLSDIKAKLGEVAAVVELDALKLLFGAGDIASRITAFGTGILTLNDAAVQAAFDYGGDGFTNKGRNEDQKRRIQKDVDETFKLATEQRAKLDARVAEALSKPYASVDNLAIKLASPKFKFNMDPEEQEKLIKDATKEATEFFEDLKKRVEAVLSDKETTNSVLVLARKEIEQFGAGIDYKERLPLLDQIQAQIEANTKAIIDPMRKAKDEIRGLFDGLPDARENPFTSLLSQMGSAAERMQKQFGALGDDAVKAFTNIEKAALRAQLANASFDVDLGALRKRQEAAQLRENFIGLTGPEDRALAVINARVAAAVDLPRIQSETIDGILGRLPGQLGGDKPATDAVALLRRQLAQLGEITGGSGRLGDATREAVNDQIIALTDKIDPAVLLKSPQLADIRLRRQQAQRDGAGKFERNLQDEIARQQAGENIQRRAVEQLNLLNRSGLTDDQKVKQFLAITGTLGDKELVGGLREGRARALEASAVLDSQQRAVAEARADRLDKMITKLDAAITDKGVKLNAGDSNIGLDVTIDENVNARQRQLGAAPTPIDVSVSTRDRSTMMGL
ncbi:MAG: hypothetical protein MSG64_06345 [Pyrinomonadaceae bacterium MAG19_C2-C3]|nr:hypothetical protein [Pyrinomonadaceae bacterium MAG19_C2-C3]